MNPNRIRICGRNMTTPPTPLTPPAVNRLVSGPGAPGRGQPLPRGRDSRADAGAELLAQPTLGVPADVEDESPDQEGRDLLAERGLQGRHLALERLGEFGHRMGGRGGVCDAP